MHVCHVLIWLGVDITSHSEKRPASLRYRAYGYSTDLDPGNYCWNYRCYNLNNLPISFIRGSTLYGNNDALEVTHTSTTSNHSLRKFAPKNDDHQCCNY